MMGGEGMQQRTDAHGDGGHLSFSKKEKEKQTSLGVGDKV
jgi:hypothetical protein